MIQDSNADIARDEADGYWGLCPECTEWRMDRMQWLNVRGDHWLVCHVHNVKWCVGYNLFSGWKNETEEIWQANEAALNTYKTVEPFFPQDHAIPTNYPNRSLAKRTLAALCTLIWRLRSGVAGFAHGWRYYGAHQFDCEMSRPGAADRLIDGHDTLF